MVENLDLNKLLKLYSDGRITKKEFVYFHAVLSQQQKQSKGKTPATIKVKLPKKHVNFVSFIKTHHKSVITFVGTLWIFISLAGPYWKDLGSSFFAPRAEITKQTLSEPPEKQPVKTIDYQGKLKTVVEALVKTPIWNGDSINEFTTTWNLLTKGEKSAIKKTVWYGEFIQKLEKQIKFEAARQEQYLDDRTVAYRQRALLRLAKTLNFNTAKIKQTFAEARTRYIAKSSKQNTATKPIYKSVQPNTAAAPKAKSAAKPKAKKQIAKSIQERDIDKVLRQYVAAFEKGNTRQITSLFADDKHLQRPLTIGGLRTQYQNLFRATDERWVEFRSISWNKKPDRAIGSGTFRTSLRSIDSGEYKTLTTNVLITLHQSKNVTRITDFEMIDNSIFSLGLSKRGTGLKTAGRDSNYPTRGELQDIVTQYRDTYQSGDVKRLMTLFASATWSSDRAGLVELKKDYENLFSSTSDRQLFISNMDWNLKNKKAMGTGDLVINLIPNDKSAITRQKGKVRMIVEKVGKKARITHLFHVVN